MLPIHFFAPNSKLLRILDLNIMIQKPITLLAISAIKLTQWGCGDLEEDLGMYRSRGCEELEEDLGIYRGKRKCSRFRDSFILSKVL